MRAISITLFKLNQGYTEQSYLTFVHYLVYYFIDMLDINFIEITYEVIL